MSEGRDMQPLTERPGYNASPNDWVLCADEVRGRLRALGFDPLTQQVAAWLGRMAREEMACVERRAAGRELQYALTPYGRTLLDNRFRPRGWAL